MPGPIYAIHEFQDAIGVSVRTLRHWIRRKLLPKPLGRGRAARYTESHLTRARVIRHLRTKGQSLETIRARIAPLTEEQLRALLPAAPRVLSPDGIPIPPAPTYPSVSWEIVTLMDGLLLLVNPEKGAVLRRVADEIYRHYGLAPGGT